MAAEFVPIFVTLCWVAGVSAGVVALHLLAGIFAPWSRRGPPTESTRRAGRATRFPGADSRLAIWAMVSVTLTASIGFLLAWAVAFGSGQPSDSSVAVLQAAVFVGPLLAIYAWLWRLGLFEAERGRPKKSGKRP